MDEAGVALAVGAAVEVQAEGAADDPLRRDTVERLPPAAQRTAASRVGNASQPVSPRSPSTWPSTPAAAACRWASPRRMPRPRSPAATAASASAAVTSS
ncbi:MAG TPA: hypothetical protein VIZ43_06050 [Trebonia sp.]